MAERAVRKSTSPGEGSSKLPRFPGSSPRSVPRSATGSPKEQEQGEYVDYVWIPFIDSRSKLFFWLSTRHELNRADLHLLREESQRMMRLRITQRTCEKWLIFYWLISNPMLTVACNVLVWVTPPRSIRRSQLIVLKMGDGTTHIRTGLIGDCLSFSMAGCAVRRGPQAHFHLGAWMMKNRMNSLILRMFYHGDIIQCETDRFQTPHVRYSPWKQIGAGTNPWGHPGKYTIKDEG